MVTFCSKKYYFLTAPRGHADSEFSFFICQSCQMFVFQPDRGERHLVYGAHSIEKNTFKVQQDFFSTKYACFMGPKTAHWDVHNFLDHTFKLSLLIINKSCSLQTKREQPLDLFEGWHWYIFTFSKQYQPTVLSCCIYWTNQLYCEVMRDMQTSRICVNDC